MRLLSDLRAGEQTLKPDQEMNVIDKRPANRLTRNDFIVLLPLLLAIVSAIGSTLNP